MWLSMLQCIDILAGNIEYGMFVWGRGRYKKEGEVLGISDEKAENIRDYPYSAYSVNHRLYWLEFE